MTTGTAPIVVCDSEMGCDQWEVDLCSTHDDCHTYPSGERIHAPEQPPGWVRAPDGSHYCPRHTDEAKD